MQTVSSSRATVPKMGCGYAVCALIGLIGVALLFAADDRWRKEKRSDALVLGTLAAVFCVGATALIGPMRREVARARERRRREEEKPHEPWTWEPAWTAAGGIAQSGRRHGRAMIICGVAAIAISLPALVATPRELVQGNLAILIALLFPTVGVGLLAAALRDARSRRKFGRALFVPAGIPIPFATELNGMVIVDRPVVPTAAGRVSLECWCTTSVVGRKTREHETTVANIDREIAPGDWEVSGNESRLLVRLPIRGGAPTTTEPAAMGRPAYEWRLRVQTPTAGTDFVAEFVLPVFRVAGVSEAATTRGEPVVTHVTPSRGNRSEIWRSAAINEESQPGANGGTALTFAHGLGRTVMFAPLTMAVIFGAIAAGLWLSPLPWLIGAFVALFALLPLLVTRMLWTAGGERVWVEGGEICVQRANRPARRIPGSAVESIEAKHSVGVGTTQFYRVVANCRSERGGRLPRRVTLAAMVRGDEAATAVIAWLRERLAKTSS